MRHWENHIILMENVVRYLQLLLKMHINSNFASRGGGGGGLDVIWIL